MGAGATEDTRSIQIITCWPMIKGFKPLCFPLLGSRYRGPTTKASVRLQGRDSRWGLNKINTLGA